MRRSDQIISLIDEIFHKLNKISTDRAPVDITSANDALSLVASLHGERDCFQGYALIGTLVRPIAIGPGTRQESR